MYNKILNVLTKHTDKVLHFAAGMVVCLIVFIPLGNYYALLAAVMAGLGKEIRDKISYGRFDWLDLLVTVAGGAFVFACLQLRLLFL